MPLYDFRCINCNKQFEEVLSIERRHKGTCPDCGGEGRRIILPGKAPGLSLFRAGFYEHCGPKGTYAETPQQLQDACDKHGVQSEYLKNSIFRTRSRAQDYAWLGHGDFLHRSELERRGGGRGEDPARKIPEERA